MAARPPLPRRHTPHTFPSAREASTSRAHLTARQRPNARLLPNKAMAASLPLQRRSARWGTFPSSTALDPRQRPYPAHRRQRRRQRYFFAKNIDNSGFSCYNKSCGFIRGEMAERFKALVLKTSDVERHRGFESLSLRQNRIDVEKYPRGRRGSPAKGVGWDNCREGSNPSFSAT